MKEYMIQPTEQGTWMLFERSFNLYVGYKEFNTQEDAIRHLKLRKAAKEEREKVKKEGTIYINEEDL